MKEVVLMYLFYLVDQGVVAHVYIQYLPIPSLCIQLIYIGVVCHHVCLCVCSEHQLS